MKLPRSSHRWKVSPREAIAIQNRLAQYVRVAPPLGELRFVAGTDLAFTRDGTRCIAGVVLWDVQENAIIEKHVATRRVTFPYVPGLLSFREAPAILAALRKLTQMPDALMCDGHGLAHPRRFGLACHVGVITDLPTVGCAKSRLVGIERSPATRRGAHTRLIDRNETIGTVLRTREGVKPVYVSVGHKLDLPAARRLVLDCAIGYRLPEPTRQADKLVARARASSIQS